MRVDDDETGTQPARRRAALRGGATSRITDPARQRIEDPARQRIEDYALIGDLETAALVGRDGSIDWACFPRFDSPAAFAALLGDAEHGRWRLAPGGAPVATRRRYRDGTLILETEFDAPGGRVRVVDAMPPRARHPFIVRLVEGLAGRVEMATELTIRFDYGSQVPWVRRAHDGIVAIAGPDALRLRTPVPLHGEDFVTRGRFTVAAGERVPFVLQWWPSHQAAPRAVDGAAAVAEAERWWRDWSARSTYVGPWEDAVRTSAVVLKALTYAPTGALIAAPTTGLPEALGGGRNWDYRYCWLRDAAFALTALTTAGYVDEARAWRDWLLRAVAGKPSQVQIMYGVAGERRLPERTLDWLPGYGASRPVRVGNAAHEQVQLDVFGEVMDAFHHARLAGLRPDRTSWALQQALMEFLESSWAEPDEGIWEVRGGARAFTHSKVMAWVAFDRAVRAAEQFGLDGPVDRWRLQRAAIHREVCERGFDADLGSFVQFYGATEPDASLLMLPLVGFLPADDPRVRGTVRLVQERLLHDGFVARYRSGSGVDGLPEGEGAFLVCTLWLADNLALQGRGDEARDVFERVLAVRNDLGLLAEEYDPAAGRLLGNFPQAFSHVGLINTAQRLAAAGVLADADNERVA